VPFWGLTIYHRVALLALCFVLAWLTKRFVEDPMRAWKPLTSRRPRVTLWASLGAMVLVGAVAAGGWAANAPAYQQGVQAIQEIRDNPPECFGAASVLDESCVDAAPDTILPAPGFAGADSPDRPECFIQLNDSRPVACEFGSDAPDAPRVALVGDSHAYQLLATFERIAEREGWHLTTYFKGACAWNTTPLATGGSFGEACSDWRDGVTSKLADSEFDAVFTAAISNTPYSSAGYDSSFDAAVAGYQEAWSAMTDRGIPVISLVDNPSWETDPNKCLRTRDASECASPRAERLTENDPIRDAAQDASGVTLLDFTDVYCDAETCFPVIGGADVYRDQDHLTVTFADTLAPQFTAAVRDAMDKGVG